MNNYDVEAPSEDSQHGNMVKNSADLLRIFWPKNLNRSTTPGVIVGWRNSEYDLFVITILEDVEVRWTLSHMAIPF